MMTPDELGPLEGLHIGTRLNDQVVQDALLGEMIFDIPTILESTPRSRAWSAATSSPQELRAVSVLSAHLPCG